MSVEGCREFLSGLSELCSLYFQLISPERSAEWLGVDFRKKCLMLKQFFSKLECFFSKVVEKQIYIVTGTLFQALTMNPTEA